MTGAELIIECLKKEGVDTIFGYPGGTVISVYDALYRNGKGIRHILTAHEQSAAHAADGYARSTGRTGVCLVTSGPGATNLVTGIATAYMDSVPLVAITINVSTESLGKDSFQEVDIAGITMPVTKYSFIVRDITKLADTIFRAFEIAQSGRPGPVLVDITRDVAEGILPDGQYEYEEKGTPDESADGRTVTDGKNPSSRTGERSNLTPDEDEVKKAVAMIKEAKKPVLLVGGGAVISRASEELSEFESVFGFPFTDTLMGKGAVKGTGEKYLGMCGIYGCRAANRALHEADLILAVGCRFSERVTGVYKTFAPHARIIQIDIDRAELNKNVRISLGICSDAASAIKAIVSKGTSKKIRKYTGWIKYLQDIKGSADCTAQGGKRKLNGPLIVRTVYGATKGDAIVATEVGLNQMWAAGNYCFKRPGQLLTSGGLGTMGYGLGAAIGAKAAHPESTVVNIAGDGCFRMNMNELITASAEGLPIIEIVIDNGMLGMVHDMQQSDYGMRFSQTEFKSRPDYAAVAKALGAEGYTVSTVKELEEALDTAVVSQKLTVIVCRI